MVPSIRGGRGRGEKKSRDPMNRNRAHRLNHLQIYQPLTLLKKRIIQKSMNSLTIC